jgi:hypothetical protein
VTRLLEVNVMPKGRYMLPITANLPVFIVILEVVKYMGNIKVKIIVFIAIHKDGWKYDGNAFCIKK